MLRSVKYGLYGAVLAGLLALPALWSTVDKTVQLVVDGRASTLHTTASNVGQVIEHAGYRVSSHDLLAPGTKAKITDGIRIVLRRGRLLHLNVDGAVTSVWTTAPTVAEALTELGYSRTDFVSVSRARRLPLGVTDIDIRTPRLITLVHDGKREQVTTTAATVGEVIDELGVSLGRRDRLSVPLSAQVRAGQTVVIQRVTRRFVTRIKRLPFHVTRRADPRMYSGRTEVVRAGRKGRVRVTFSYVYVDGRMVGKTRLHSVLIARPRTEILRVGTKSRPSTSVAAAPAPAPSAPAPSPGTAKAIARDLLANRGWGDVQYDCLVVMWDHESGWNVHAANPSGAYGIPQALPGWKMSSAGPDWQNNATTQIKWGLGYIAGRYGTPCGAWSFWQANGWY